MQDARWLAQLHRCGLIEGSMVPEQDIRDLRDLTRYRSKMVQAVTAEKNRIHKNPAGCQHQANHLYVRSIWGFGTGPAPEDHVRRGRRRSGR
ncbi:transposase [Paenibacillus rhizoplanae]